MAINRMYAKDETEDWETKYQKLGERIARAIEVAEGIRCPECDGKAASIKRDKRHPFDKLGRCGAGHTWVHSWRTDWKDHAAIARELGGKS
jgi:hypothetical protein